MIVPYPRRRLPWRWTARRVGAVAFGFLLVTGISVGSIVAVSLAQAPDCDTADASATTTAAARLPSAALAGHPVDSVADGANVVFVSLHSWSPGERDGIEVLRRGADGLHSLATIPLSSAPSGLALSPDAKTLLAAVDDGVEVLDAPRAATGDPSAILGLVPTSPGAGTDQLEIAGHYLVTADQNTGHVSVLDLPRIESGDFGPSVQLAQVNVDMGPAGLGVSPDGRYVYVVSQVQQPVMRFGPSDFVYGLLTYVGLPRRAGTLSVIDTTRIDLDPAGAVVARVPAGCAPVRVAAAPDGKTIWVTARRSNELLAFRTDQLLAGRATGPVARVPVTAAPEGLGLVRNGRFALVAGSDRTRDAGSAQAVSVVDTAAVLSGRRALRTTVAVGGLPAEIDVTPDQRTAYVANNGTSTLSLVDVSRLVGG